MKAATRISGGERARALLARMLAVQAELLLVDEPVASLDPAQQIAAMNLLSREARAGRTIIAVLHDLSLAARFASRIIVLSAGRVVADGSPAKLIEGHAFDQAFGVHFSTGMTEAGIAIVPMRSDGLSEKA